MLNCVERKLPSQNISLLFPAGAMKCSVFPTPCLWEMKWVLNAGIPFWLSFLSLSKPRLQQEKAVGFCLLLQCAESSSRRCWRGRNVKLCILYNDKQDKHYLCASLWGRLTHWENPKKTWRELLEEIMKGDLQREGAMNLWITFFSSLFIMHRGHERGFLAVLSYSKRIFFWFLLLFYIKNSSLALNRRLWSKQHQRHAQVRIKYIGKDIWLVPILHWVLKVADKSQQIWRFKNQTKFSSAATNTSRIQKKWTYLNY